MATTTPHQPALAAGPAPASPRAAPDPPSSSSSASSSSSSDSDNDDTPPPTPPPPFVSPLAPGFFQGLPDEVLDGIVREAGDNGSREGEYGNLDDVLALHATCSRMGIRAQRYLSGEVDLIGGEIGSQDVAVDQLRERIVECDRLQRPFIGRYLRVHNYVFEAKPDDDLTTSTQNLLSFVDLLASRRLFEFSMADSLLPANVFEALYAILNKHGIKSLTLIRVRIEASPKLEIPFLPTLDRLLHLVLSYCDTQAMSIFEVSPSLISVGVITKDNIPVEALLFLKDSTSRIKHLAVSSGNSRQVSEDLLPHLLAEGEAFARRGIDHPVEQLFVGVGPDGWQPLVDTVRNLPRLRSLYVGLEGSLKAEHIDDLRDAAPGLYELILGAHTWPDSFESYVNALTFSQLVYYGTNWIPAIKPSVQKIKRQSKHGNITLLMMRLMGRTISSLRRAFFLRGTNEDGAGTGIAVKFKRGPRGGVTPLFNPQATFKYFEGRYEEWAEESL